MAAPNRPNPGPGNAALLKKLNSPEARSEHFRQLRQAGVDRQRAQAQVTARLADLTPEQRKVVEAIVAADKAAREAS